MRKLRVLVFLGVGLLQGLSFLELFFFHLMNGNAIQYGFMVLFGVGSIACLRAARTDWRAAPRPSEDDRQLGRP